MRTSRLIKLSPAWGIVYEDGSPEPYVLMRLKTEASRYRSYPSLERLLAEMRDRLGKVDQEAWKEVLRLRSSGQLVERGGIGRHHWL